MVVTTGAVRRAKQNSPPTNQHPAFYGPDALPVAQPAVSKHLREKVSHATNLFTPSSSGGLQTVSLTTKGSWLPWEEVLPSPSSAL